MEKMHSLLAVLLVTVFVSSVSPDPADGPGDTETDPADAVSPADSLVWGPGLDTHFVVPVRYFFIQLKDDQKTNITHSVGPNPFDISITQEKEGRVRVHLQQLDRSDGSYIVRYKLYQPLQDAKVAITFRGAHVGSSPYYMKGNVYQEGCYCPVLKIDKWLKAMKCPASYSQIDRDLAAFPDIHMSKVAPEVQKRFNQSGSRSLCRYVIKDNKLYRSTMGKHVGFKMFSDAMILSLLRKVKVPDMEFFVNLGDWPLEKRTLKENPLPILSWCGSDDTRDIVMPTYDLTESTLETMGRCENTTSNTLAMPTYEMDEEKLSGSCRTTLDLLSVQGNTPWAWGDRLDTGFWRGRDSRRERLELVKMSRRHPKVIDAKLTNMFFFKHDKEELGELVKHISFFDFFTHKYQINIDGTVAAYRFPYLLAGRSVTLKHNSQYYEHFYGDLEPYVHYIPFKDDLSDLLEKLQWAKDNDGKAQQIAANARQFVVDHLLAKDIYCYHVQLFKNYASRLRDQPELLPDMEHVLQPDEKFDTKCTCVRGSQKTKDEL